MRIGVTMISQILLVPIFLSYWDVVTYGVWIAIQAIINLISTLDQGHQTYLEYEFLKDGVRNRKKIAYNLWSSIWIAPAIGLLQVLIVWILTKFDFTIGLLGIEKVVNPVLLKQAGLVLILQAVSWAIFSSIGGIFVRVLSPFGYYSRMSWWGVSAAVVNTFAPVIAVMFGADILTAGIVLVLSTAAYAIPQFIDVFRLLKRENLLIRDSSFKTGLYNFTRSLAISAKSLLENARQQGVRVILAPLSGAAALVAFSTMRTGANIVLQGLNTITSPLMPELMRFLNDRNQQKMEASFSTVWLVLITLLSPGVILLQTFIGPLFFVWTKGQVAFDPLLFALLSMGVLTYAVAQPAIAVVRGNNLLRPQLTIAILAALIVVGGMFVSVPVWGIAGAGASLLAGEIAATIAYRIVAQKWLNENGLEWPSKPSRLGMAATYLAGLTMLAMYLLPDLRLLCSAVGLVGMLIIIRIYLKSLPAIAVQKLQQMRGKIPILRNLSGYAAKK